jgi:preprotein translocase subunit SecB
VDFDTEVEDFHRHEEDEESHAIVGLRARIDWGTEEEPDRSGPFDLEITVRGIFIWPSLTLEEDVAQAWIDHNATHLLWPYLRTFITTITALSRLPALTIYTMTVPESPDFESEENVAQPSAE